MIQSANMRNYYRPRCVGGVNFSGRSSRTELIVYLIALSLISWLLRSLLIFGVGHESFETLGTLISFIFYAPLPALFARRLHDQGKSAWWTSLLLAPVAIGCISSPDGDPQPFIILQSIGLVSAVVIIVLSLWKGNAGGNAYGPDPRFPE